jgi:NADH:ubiquinone oxidoreductase subunit 3 (subunit A)
MSKEKIEENYWLVVCLLVIISILIFLITMNFISNNENNNENKLECYKIGNLPQELILINTTDNPFIEKYFNGTSYEICRNKRE